MKTKYVFLIISQYHQETDPRGDWVRARVQGHTGDSGAESGLDPRATPGYPPPRSALAPVEVPPFPVQAGGKLGPKGPPDSLHPSLSCLVPCRTAGQAALADLALAWVPHLPASHGLLS